MNPEAIKAAAQAWERGRALQKAGRYREAEPEFRAALKVMPGSAQLLADYGRLAEQLKDWRAAANIWQAVAKTDPTRQVGDHVGLALLQLERNAEALPWLETFAARHPADTDSAINLAVGYTRLGRDADAITVLRNATMIRPREGIWEALITLLINDTDRAGAGEALQAALAQFPQSKELRYMLMEHRLKCGEFGAGFDMFDTRWETRFFEGKIILARDKRWDGQPFEGRLLVRAEQGVGDELLYSSLFTDLLVRHANTVIECEARLQPLFARSWPQATFIARGLPESHPAKAGFTHDVMAGDLYRMFRRTVDDFPARSGWLAADQAPAGAIEADLRIRFGHRLRVGLSWRSMHPGNGTAKSLTLTQLLPLLRIPDVQFIDLQYGDTAAELAALREQQGIDIYHDPGINALKDLDAFAAQLCALDLVISTSNTTAHLAGALGVPTWVLLHRDRGLPWYWGYEGAKVPWYGHTELIRCQRRGEWEPVIAEAAARLGRRVAERPATHD